MATTVADSTLVEQKGRAAYTTLAVTGLLLVASAPLLMTILVVASGGELGEFATFLAMTIAAPAIAAVLVWRFGAWAKLVGLLAVLFVGAMMFWVAFGLGYVRSFGDFMPGVLLLLGVIVGIGGSVAAIVRRRDRSMAMPAGERLIVRSALAIVLLAAVVSGVGNLTARSAPAEVEGAVPTTMRDFSFDAEMYRVAAGEPTTLRVHNGDAFTHTFTVDALGVDVTMLPGSTRNIEISPAAGSYILYCRPHTENPESPGEHDMAATIIAE